MSRRMSPPRLAERLLAWAVPMGSFGTHMMGDLAEEYVRVRSRRGRLFGDAWYAWESVRLGGRFIVRRIRGRFAGDGNAGNPGPYRGTGRSMLRDLAFAVRLARKQLGVTAVIVLTLALGIGANAAIFSVVSGVLLRPLPFEDPDRLVHFVNMRKGEHMFGGTFSYLDFEDYRDGVRQFEDVLAYLPGARTVLGRGEPQRIATARVSGPYFDLFGVRPAVGRFFLSEEDRLGHAPVLVLSHAYWQESFGGDSAIVGSTVSLDKEPYTVVGVAPASFEDPFGDPVLWIARPPIFDAQRHSRHGYLITLIARIRPGVSLPAAEADVERVTTRLREEFPDKDGFHVMLRPVTEVMLGDFRAPVMMLFGAAALLLLVACANVANLAPSRSAARVREFALRAVLGAGRGAVVRQVLIESLCLAVVSGVIGLGLAALGVDLIIRIGGASIPRGHNVGVDGLVITVTGLITVASAALFGLAPALYAVRSDPAPLLRGGDRGGEGRVMSRLRAGIVTVEVALSLVLLAGGGLLLRSVWSLWNVDVGIETENVLTFMVTPNDDDYSEREHLSAFWSELETQLSTVPGVVAAGGATQIPMGTGMTSCFGFQRDDRPPPEPGQWRCAQARTVTPGYFRAAGVRLVRGRFPDERDGPNANQVLAINETMAREEFPGENPLGKRLTIQRTSQEIVGIVGDVKQGGPDQDVVPMVYTHQAQEPATWMRERMIFTLRTARHPLSVAEEARRAVWSVDPTVPITDVRTMERVVADNIQAPRFRATLVGAFAVVGVILAILGVASVITYAVSHRVREFGIRMAVGADARSLIRLVVGDGIRLTAVGLVVGLAAAAAVARLLQGLLFGVSSLDPAVFLGAPALLVMAAFLASYVPARRVGRIDPVKALRTE